uniref:Uncharacterized protein n=1 Tax=Siphoviridae sp. cthrK8 TaxID=2826429 RepID=A0A8S5N003_9CAUD|nr:MAG TPA: hypothetical protein [Siphoviridae sp. cthrK8]
MYSISKILMKVNFRITKHPFNWTAFIIWLIVIVAVVYLFTK